MKQLLLFFALLLSTSVFAQADLVVTNTDYKDTYIPGVDNVYTVTVVNYGPNAAVNVNVSNAIPAGITYFSWQGSNGSTGENVALNNTIPNLAVGAMVTYIITMEIPGALNGNLTSTTVVTSPTPDPNPGCAQCTDIDTKAIGADLEVTNTNNQDVYVAGTTTVYTVTVANNGPLTAANVAVQNAIPAGITQFSWTGSNGSSGTNEPLDNTITSLPAGQQVVYTITVQIPAAFTGNLVSQTTWSTPTTDPIAGCAACIDTDIQGSGADLLITNSNNQDTYVSGTTSVYTVTVTNNGPEAAANVVVSNAIPAGITSFSWTGSNGSSGTDVALSDAIASLANGASVTYTITLDIPAGFTGDLTSQTVVTSDTTDPTPACPACIDTDTRVFGADLEITNSDGTNVYTPGADSVYTLTILNNGPEDAVNVEVLNAIPAGITNFSWTGTNGSSGTNVDLADTIALLANGTSVVYTITLGVPAAYTGNLVSEATVTSDTTDMTPACPACIDTNIMASGADLITSISNGSSTYTAGASTTYTITVLNNGPEDATDVLVDYAVPAGIPAGNVTWTGPGGPGTGPINMMFSTLPVGSTITYQVTVVVPSDFDTETDLVNTVTVTSATSDPNPDCPQCTDTDTPAASANLVTLKTNGQTQFLNSVIQMDTGLPVYIEETTTYSITITNQGPSDAVNVSVSDPLPSGITEMWWVGSNGTSGTGPLTDVIANLPAGEIASYLVTIVVPVNYDLTHPNLINVVTVSSDTPDPVPACPGCSDVDTPAANFVTVKPSTTYTAQQIVEDILIHSECADVSNFLISAGTNNTGVTYFNRNNSDFPLKEGVIIRCGTAADTQGPFTGGSLSTIGSNQLDAQLQSFSTGGGTIRDVSALSFDFTPLTDNFSFKFLFASNEYGQFQCNFGDVFAFILTDITAGTPAINIAYIPGITPPTPVSVTTIRDAAYNTPGNFCASVNPQWFGQYNVDDPANAAINMRGQAKPMIASATVIPGNTYNIRLVIGDYSDTAFDSAVFIEGGSFDIGQANITGATAEFAGLNEFTIESGSALCAESVREIKAGSSSIDGATYTWYLNDVEIPGEDEYILAVSEPGIYQVVISIGGVGGCSQSDTIIVEYLPIVPFDGDPVDLPGCPTFNLYDNDPIIIGNTDPDFYVIGYHTTLEDAQNAGALIPNADNYAGNVGDTIYVSIMDVVTNCIVTREFTLIAAQPAGQPDDLYACALAAANGEAVFDFTPQVALVLNGSSAANYDVSFHNSLFDAKFNIDPIDPFDNYTGTNGEVIYVRMADVNNPLSYCTTSFTLHVNLQPEPIDSYTIQQCEPYELPVVPAGTSYFTQTGGVGDEYFAGDIIDGTMGITELYIYAESGTSFNCTSEGVITFLFEAAVDVDVDDVTVCDEYILPALPVNQTYHTATGGDPSTLITDYVITTTQEIFVFYELDDCTAEDSFVVTVNDTPPVPTVTDITETGGYILPALPAGSVYTTEPDCAGTIIPAGTELTVTQTIYVCAQTSTIPNCFSSAGFDVTIINCATPFLVDDVTACDEYILPVLPANTTYHDAPNGGGNEIPALTPITTTQLIYVFVTTGNVPDCPAEDTFTVTINETPDAPLVADVSACDSYILPALAAGQFYWSDFAGGTPMAEGDEIFSTMDVIVSNETGTTPNCVSEATFTVTINQTPVVDELPDVSACDCYELAVLTVGNYFTGSGGTGTMLMAGEQICASGTIYIYEETGTTPNCSDESSFTITINQTPPTPVVADVIACDTYTLPVLPAGSSYHTEPGGDTPIGSMDITQTQIIYVFAETDTTPNCSSEASFTVTINETPDVDAPADVVACDSYELPPLTVGNYFDAPGGNGTQYFATDVITTSMTMYVYGETGTTPNCFDQNSFEIGIFTSPTITDPTPLQTCDDNFDGIACFTLSDKDAEITNNQAGLVVSYHETLVDAQNGNSPIGPAYCNIAEGIQTIYVRVFNVAAPQCASTTSLVLIVNPRPTPNPSIADYELCDVNNPGDGIEGFDLESMNTEILFGQTGIAITYFESQADAQNNVNAIDTSVPYDNTSNPQQICARMTNTTTGCFTVVCFNLVVNPLPQVVAPAAMNACSDGVTNEGLFDLASNDGFISNFANGVQVTYHQTLADAQNEANALASPYLSAPTTLFVRVENVATGCFDTTTLTLNVSQGPVAMTPSPLVYCDPNNDCIGEFMLTDADIEISGGSLQPGVTITYHETEEDAQNDVFPLMSPYSNIDPCLQTIYVRVEYDFTGCTNFTQLQLIVNPTPVANDSATPLEVCDDNTDGFACFDLNLATADILNGLDPAEFDVTYYVAQPNAISGTNAITNLTCYTNNTQGTQTIWVRVENKLTGCYDVVSLDLIVNPLPTVAFPIPSYTLCDIVTPDDQMEVFDLASQIPMIIGTQSNMQVTFHFSAAQALAGTDELPLSYTNTATAQTLHVRLENTETGCFVTSTMDIRVEPLPAPIVPLPSDPLLNLCDANGDGIASFDLNALIADMQSGTGSFTIAFYDTEQDALTNQTVNQLPSPYINSNPYTQTIWVTATNTNAPFCTRIFSLVLNVIDSPVIGADTLEDLSICDTGNNNQDGFAVFNLTVQNADILDQQDGPSANYDISYYTTLAAAQSGIGRILTPQAFTNTIANSQPIWVRVEDSMSECVAIGSFMLFVDVPLALTTPTPLALCDEEAPSANPSAVFDLTVKNDEITQNNAGYTVQYFVTQADQLAGTNPIADPTAYTSLGAAQTLYVSVTSPGAGCISYTTLTIRVLPLPTPLEDLSNHVIELCDDNNSPDGEEFFDLTINEAYIANGDPNLAFTYFETLADAMVPINAIATPDNHNSASGIIYIRVNKIPAVDFEGNNCYVIVEQPILVNPLPIVNALSSLQGCDATGNGTAEFDLQGDGNELVLDASQDVADFTFTYHASLADAQNGVAPLADMYTSGPGSIFVRVQNNDTGCANFGQVDLTVFAGATITAPDPNVDPLEACADVGDPDNDSATFDLTILDAQILGGQLPANFVVDYYATLVDAQDDLPIANYVAYLADNGFVYATVKNVSTGCRSSIIAIPVLVESLPLPVVTSVSGGNTICVDYFTTAFLSGQTLSSGYVASADYDFQWYLDATAIAGATQPDYTITTIAPGSYTVMVTSTSDLGCSVESAAFTVIQSSAAVIDPATDGIGWTVTNAFEDVQDLIITVSGFGDYQYSLDYGPFQDSNIFTNVGDGVHFVTVRDKNNTECGPPLVITDIRAINYPHYFTPNGDGIHDTWNIWSLRGDSSAKIYIFDRYGKLIKQISPEGQGWDGTFNGQMLPGTDYWFKVIFTEPTDQTVKEFKAHFSLKR